MAYDQLHTCKHRITLTGEEIALLRDRLVPIDPSRYTLRSFAILRNLYGRFDSQVTQDLFHLEGKEAG